MSMRHGYSGVRVPLVCVALTFAFAIANAGCGGSGERSPSAAEVGRRIDEQVSSFLADNEVTGEYTRLRTVAVSVDGHRRHRRLSQVVGGEGHRATILGEVRETSARS